MIALVVHIRINNFLQPIYREGRKGKCENYQESPTNLVKHPNIKPHPKSHFLLKWSKKATQVSHLHLMALCNNSFTPDKTTTQKAQIDNNAIKCRWKWDFAITMPLKCLTPQRSCNRVKLTCEPHLWCTCHPLSDKNLSRTMVSHTCRYNYDITSFMLNVSPPTSIFDAAMRTLPIWNLNIDLDYFGAA